MKTQERIGVSQAHCKTLPVTPELRKQRGRPRQANGREAAHGLIAGNIVVTFAGGPPWVH